MDNLFFDRSQLKHCGKNVIIGKTVRIRHPEKVSVGDNVIIDDFCYIDGMVEIGDYVHIANGCTLSAGPRSIHMGPFSGLSAGCRVYAGSSNYLSCGLDMPTIPREYVYNVVAEEVVLSRFVIIGANSIILPGVNIPEGMAFAANLVIRKKQGLQSWTIMLDQEGTTRPRKGVQQMLDKVKEFYTFKD